MIKSCLFCQKQIKSKHSNTKYCSLQCYNCHKHELAQNQPIKNNCLQCNTPTNNPKFCSSKCSNTHNNSKRVCKITCKKCDSVITSGSYNRKYCDDCHNSKKVGNYNYRDWSKITLDDLFKRLTIHQANARIRELSRTSYKKSNKPKKCCSCGYSHFYEVCHIKAIKNFDKSTPISIVNHIDNLIGLCPNCHWEFDNDKLTIENIKSEI